MIGLDFEGWEEGGEAVFGYGPARVGWGHGEGEMRIFLWGKCQEVCIASRSCLNHDLRRTQRTLTSKQMSDFSVADSSTKSDRHIILVFMQLGR